MKNTNKWHFVNHDEQYHDYDKELYSMPDDGNTSIDMRLTFDSEDRICYYTISLHNDNGDTIDWEKTHRIPWDTGVAMLAADGMTFFKESTA